MKLLADFDSVIKVVHVFKFCFCTTGKCKLVTILQVEVTFHEKSETGTLKNKIYDPLKDI